MQQFSAVSFQSCILIGLSTFENRDYDVKSVMKCLNEKVFL